MSEVEATPVEVVEQEKSVTLQKREQSLVDKMFDGTGSDPEVVLKKITAIEEVLSFLRASAIRQTFPTDWIIHVSKDSDGNVIREVGYLQDCGAERAGKMFGIGFDEAPMVKRENFPDQTFAYHFLATAYSKVTGEVVQNCEGSRWSGDSFFTRGLKEDEQVNPVDVRKSAYANLHGRAVRALAGLNAVPLPALSAAGVDITKVVHVNYGKGTKGGQSTGAARGTSEVKIAWGNAKGQTVGELSDKDLTFYIGRYENDVNDPTKEKFKANAERMLTALKAEHEKREASKQQEKDGGTSGDQAGTSQSLGDRKTAMYKKINSLKGDTTSREALAHISRHLKADLKAFSDITQDQLGELECLPDEVLAEVVKGA